MLDILGNVFGKSKKNNNNAPSSSQNGSNEEGNDNEVANDGYVFVSHNESQRTQFGQTTILTDELIRMGSSSSMVQQANPNSNHNNSNPNGGQVYPNLADINRVNPNPNLPFSSSSGPRNSLSVNNVSNSIRNASPIDNVPFSLTTGGSAGGNGGGGGFDEDSEVTEILNRMHQFVNNSNLSEYNFKLENSILRESFLT